MRKLLWVLPWTVVASSANTTIQYEGVVFTECNEYPLEACKDFVEAMNTAHEWRTQQTIKPEFGKPSDTVNLEGYKDPGINPPVEQESNYIPVCYDAYDKEIPCE